MQTALLTRESLATRWKLKIKTLDQWRWSGRGPQYVKIGREIFYRLPTVEQFEESKEQKSTSTPPSRAQVLAAPAPRKKSTKLFSSKKG
jgi:hypothetical protein